MTDSCMPIGLLLDVLYIGYDLEPYTSALCERRMRTQVFLERWRTRLYSVETKYFCPIRQVV